MTTALLVMPSSQTALATGADAPSSSQDGGLTVQNASYPGGTRNDGDNSDGIDPDSRFAEGQALVVYHTSNAEENDPGFSPFFSLRSKPEDALATEGFTVEESFDLSEADAIAAENAAVGKRDALSARSFDNKPDASSDVRVALVSKQGDSTESLLSELSTLSYVEACAPNYYHSLCSFTDPDDPLFQKGYQYGLTDDDAGIDYASALVQDGDSGTENVVAVIDTGVDYTNPDLTNIMWRNPFPGELEGSCGYDFADGDDDPRPGTTREASHGTHCAGVIAAQTDNGEGIAGTAQHTRIMALKIAPDQTVGTDISDIAIVGAYEYLVKARARGVDLVAANNSWDLGPYSPVLDYLVNQAGKAGILSFFAAGNNGSDTDSQVDGATIGLESPYAIVVASSTVGNKLSSFSNYNATAVDVAAPGSAVVSTVRTSEEGGVSEYPYNATLAQASGKPTLYYQPFGDFAEALNAGTTDQIKWKLMKRSSPTSSDWQDTPPEDRDHVRFEAAGVDGINSLKITLDLDALSPSGQDKDPWLYLVAFQWDIDNPFLGQTISPSGYAVSGSTSFGARSSENASDYGTYQAVGNVQILAGDEIIAAGTYDANADFMDNGDGIFSRIDSSSGKLTCHNFIQVGRQDHSTDDSASCYATDFGIGALADAPDYAYMSGTSMATPQLTGSAAELASLYPDESALELRGRVVGGSEPLDSSDQGKVASDGRFSFEAAVDDASINATTWSIACDGSQVTVHGYNLDRAALAVDGSPAEPSSRSGDAITFSAPSSLFNGGRHRFDVTDTLTGRVYKAAYTVPLQTETSLVNVGPLPGSADQTGTGVFVSATDRLFFADTNGSYLYSCTDPSAPSPVWEQLPVPQSVYQSQSNPGRTTIRYTYANGRLYAFCTDLRHGGSSDSVAIFCSIYNIKADAWSAPERVGTLSLEGNSSGYILTETCSWNGRACFIVNQTVGEEGPDEEHTRSVLSIGSTDGTTFEQIVVPSDALENVAGVFTASEGSDGKLYCLMEGSDGTQANVVSYTRDGKWTFVGSFPDAPEMTESRMADFLEIVKTPVGNGLLAIGKSYQGIGDTMLLNPVDLTWEGLGSSLGTSADAITPSSAAMFEGRVYLSGMDDPALYVLPDAMGDRLSSIDRTVGATVSDAEGGRATVEDWRGLPAESLNVRRGDTAVWNASAQDGYLFDGWYDLNGNLVSGNERYETGVTNDGTLSAHFTPASAPVPAPTPSPSTPSATTLAETGDQTGVLMWPLLGTFIVATVVVGANGILRSKQDRQGISA